MKHIMKLALTSVFASAMALSMSAQADPIVAGGAGSGAAGGGAGAAAGSAAVAGSAAAGVAAVTISTVVVAATVSSAVAVADDNGTTGTTGTN